MFRLPAIRQAEAHAENGGKVYMYYWTQPSAIPLRGACHAVELDPLLDQWPSASYASISYNVPFVRRSILAGAAAVALGCGLVHRTLNSKNK